MPSVTSTWTWISPLKFEFGVIVSWLPAKDTSAFPSTDTENNKSSPSTSKASNAI